jgi:hypothetical protein
VSLKRGREKGIERMENTPICVCVCAKTASFVSTSTETSILFIFIICSLPIIRPILKNVLNLCIEEM